MSGWQTLQEVGAFRFDAAIEETTALLNEAEISATDLANETRDEIALTFDLTLLGAAAFQTSGSALVRPEDGPRETLPIANGLSRASFLKFACCLTMIHGGRSTGQLSVFDVVPFSGDAAKLTAVGVSSASDLAVDFDRYFQGVVRLYQSSRSPLPRSIAASGWLHLEGLVWRATLQRLVDPDTVAESVGEHIRLYGDKLSFLRREIA